MADEKPQVDGNAPKGFEAMKHALVEFTKLYEPLRNNKDGIPLTKFRGQWLPVWLPLLWPQIHNFPVKSEDIVVASFPKSGTNWLHYIVYLVETGNLGGTLSSEDRMLLELPKPPLPSTLERFAARPGQKFLATHLPISLLPKDAFNGRVIYIYRNAKDTAVSYYYHHTAMSNDMWPFKETFEEFVKTFTSGEMMFGPYPSHVKGYADALKQGSKKLLMLRYEDVKKDPKKVIREIAEFLGKQLDDATIDKIQELSSFNKMHDNDALNWSDAKKAGMWNPKIDFIRKGTIGDWRNHFKDAELLAKFEKFIQDSMPAELIPPCE